MLFRSVYCKKSGKTKSTGNSKIKYFGGSRKNSKYKGFDMSNLISQNNKKNYPSKKKYSPHNNYAKKKNNSVEPPTHELKMVSSPGGHIKYHRHNKSVNNPKHNNIGVGKTKLNKNKHYVMSQGNSELKQTLEKAKKKGKALRSLHRSDLNSLENDNSSEYDIVRDMDQPMVSNEMHIPTELYNSYKRQKLISSAMDTPISHFSKDTSPHFAGNKKGKVRASSLAANNPRTGSSKEKKRASSSNSAQHRHYMVNPPNHSTNSHDMSAHIDNYSLQKYYDIYNNRHNKSAHTSAPKHLQGNYSNLNWELAPGFAKNIGLKVIEENTSKKGPEKQKKQIVVKSSNESSQNRIKDKRSSEKIKVVPKKNKPKELEIEKEQPPPEFLSNRKGGYQSKPRKSHEQFKQHRKTKSISNQVHSQLNNYDDMSKLDGKKNSNFLDYQDFKYNNKQKGERKAESKNEHYTEKLEENSITGKDEEIKHSDLLSYIQPKLFYYIPDKEFKKLSPRSKEINSTIRLVK